MKKNNTCIPSILSASASARTCGSSSSRIETTKRNSRRPISLDIRCFVWLSSVSLLLGLFPCQEIPFLPLSCPLSLSSSTLFVSAFPSNIKKNKHNSHHRGYYSHSNIWQSNSFQRNNINNNNNKNKEQPSVSSLFLLKPSSFSLSSSTTNTGQSLSSIMTMRNRKPSSSHTTTNGSTTSTSSSSSSTTSLKMMTTPYDATQQIMSFLSSSTSPIPWQACIIYIVCNVIGFLISIMTKSHVHLDLIGTGAFALATIPALKTTTILPQYVQWSSWAICIWGIKLASFLFYRACQVGHDGRLTEQLSTIFGMFQFWLVTLFWNICTSLPYLLGMLQMTTMTTTTKSVATTTTASSSSSFLTLGAIVFVIGLIIETMADAQKWFFKQSHASNEFCNVGLWKISQHPNFFGNFVLWMGIFIMNLPGLLPSSHTATITTTTTTMTILEFVLQYWKLGIAMISPLFLLGLFYGQAQGMILDAVGMAQSKYGHDPNYAIYLEEVPLIFPNPFLLLKQQQQE